MMFTMVRWSSEMVPLCFCNYFLVILSLAWLEKWMSTNHYPGIKLSWVVGRLNKEKKIGLSADFIYTTSEVISNHWLEQNNNYCKLYPYEESLCKEYKTIVFHC